MQQNKKAKKKLEGNMDLPDVKFTMYAEKVLHQKFVPHTRNSPKDERTIKNIGKLNLDVGITFHTLAHL